MIFVARGLESPANEFGREPDIGLIFEYFLPRRISFPNFFYFVEVFNLTKDLSQANLVLLDREVRVHGEADAEGDEEDCPDSAADGQHLVNAARHGWKVLSFLNKVAAVVATYFID